MLWKLPRFLQRQRHVIYIHYIQYIKQSTPKIEQIFTERTIYKIRNGRKDGERYLYIYIYLYAVYIYLCWIHLHIESVVRLKIMNWPCAAAAP